MSVIKNDRSFTEQKLKQSIKLDRQFYNRETIDVARDLLGKCLVHRTANGNLLSGLIVETEAYIGVEDPACHAYGGRRTPRNEVLFGQAGHAYIYQIYGLHFCINAVTTANSPEAVLIRALEPLHGTEHMKIRRQTNLVSNLTSGPGKLCEALGINRSQNGLDFFGEILSIYALSGIGAFSIREGPRIGVDYAGDAAFWPLRFAINGHFCLSKPI